MTEDSPLSRLSENGKALKDMSVALIHPAVKHTVQLEMDMFSLPIFLVI